MKYKKMISLMLALGISMCFVGCGDADGSANTGTAENSLIDATVTETVAVQTDSISQTDFSTPETTTVSEETTTEEETTTTQEEKSQPKKPTYKYPSMSEGNLGERKQFVADLEDKLTLLLGDDYIFYLEDSATTDFGDYVVFGCRYKFKCSSPKAILEGYFYTLEDINTGMLTQVEVTLDGGIWDTPYNDLTGENPISEVKEKRAFKTSVCVLLSPLAVWENYSSEEEILSRFDEYENIFDTERSICKYLESDYYESEVNLKIAYSNTNSGGEGGSDAVWKVPVKEDWEMLE